MNGISHFNRAAWAGTRIILAQVSPESVGIFDFILRAYDACKGDWDSLINDKPSMTALDDIEAFSQLRRDLLVESRKLLRHKQPQIHTSLRVFLGAGRKLGHQDAGA